MAQGEIGKYCLYDGLLFTSIAFCHFQTKFCLSTFLLVGLYWPWDGCPARVATVAAVAACVVVTLREAGFSGDFKKNV